MTNRIPTWTLQRIENGEWTDVASESSIPEIRDRHTEHTKADPGGIYRVARSDERPTTKES